MNCYGDATQKCGRLEKKKWILLDEVELNWLPMCAVSGANPLHIPILALEFKVIYAQIQYDLCLDLGWRPTSKCNNDCVTEMCPFGRGSNEDWRIECMVKGTHMIMLMVEQ